MTLTYSHGVLQRERAEIGVYISFEEPTKPMQREAAEAGFYTSADGSRYPRLQLLTIRDLLEGHKTVQRPLHVRDITFKKAPRSRSNAAENLSLNLGISPTQQNRLDKINRLGRYFDTESPRIYDWTPQDEGLNFSSMSDAEIARYLKVSSD